MGSGPSVSVIIPALNEASRIARVLEALRPFGYQIIVVDDGSRDDTAAVAATHGAEVIRHSSPKGYIEAIKSGFRTARANVVVTVDADGELPVAQLERLVQPIVAGSADMVQGRRNRIVRPSERALTLLARLGGRVGDSGTGLRAIRADLAQRLEIRGRCICGVLSLEVLKRGGRIAEIPVRLQTVKKPRSIAWYHLEQVFWVLRALFRRQQT